MTNSTNIWASREFYYRKKWFRYVLALCVCVFLSYWSVLGKSAIVSALQLCLGATAKTTGRGSNLSTFICQGTDGPAIARVTLLNEGVDAYRPELFGKRIVIERKINKNGTSQYTLYKRESSTGLTKISTERRELDNILRCFNIYVDNPCCVLTQEEAKKFIQGKDEDKFEFFLKVSAWNEITGM